MKAFVFKSRNGNCYLYSPKNKCFLPISLHTYNAIHHEDISSDSTTSYLASLGYLDSCNQTFSHFLKEEDIFNALCNVPQIVFEVTTQCNLSCKYCCYGECYETFSKRKPGILKFSSAKTLLDFISNLCNSKNNISVNTPLVISFYGGEPLLNISLIKSIVDYAKSLSFPGRFLRFSLTTNATHLAKNIDFLYKNNFALLVSLDGDKTNNSYRVFHNGKEAYEDIISNLEFVKNEYPEYFKTIRFNSVYTNLSNTEDLFNYFHSAFGKIPTLSPLHQNDGKEEHKTLKRMKKNISFPSKKWFELYPESFLEMPIHKKIVHLLLYMTDSLHFNEQSFINSFTPHNTFPTHTCIPFSKRLFLTHDGNIIPCEKVNRDNPLGYISESNVVLNFETISNNFNSLVSKYKNICSKCALERICNHCAFTSSNFDKICPEFKNYDFLEATFADIFTYIEDNPGIINKIFDNTVLK